MGDIPLMSSFLKGNCTTTSEDRAPSPEGPASLLIGRELARSGSALGGELEGVEDVRHCV